MVALRDAWDNDGPPLSISVERNSLRVSHSSGTESTPVISRARATTHDEVRVRLPSRPNVIPILFCTSREQNHHGEDTKSPSPSALLSFQFLQAQSLLSSKALCVCLSVCLSRAKQPTFIQLPTRLLSRIIHLIRRRHVISTNHVISKNPFEPC